MYFYNNTCLQNCPVGYWGNYSTYNCDACPTGCASCFGPAISQCTICSNDSSTIYYKYIGSTICNTTCPDGQYISSLVTNLCLACNSICITCYGTAQNCTSMTCQQNYFFLNNTCLSVCPNNYYADSALWQCTQCTGGCQTCYGSGLSACTKCNIYNGSQFYLQIGLDKCNATCNSG